MRSALILSIDFILNEPGTHVLSVPPLRSPLDAVFCGWVFITLTGLFKEWDALKSRGSRLFVPTVKCFSCHWFLMLGIVSSTKGTPLLTVAAFSEHLQCARHWAKHFKYFILFNSDQWSNSLHSRRNRNLGRLSHFSKGIWVSAIEWQTGIQGQITGCQKPCRLTAGPLAREPAAWLGRSVKHTWNGARMSGRYSVLVSLSLRGGQSEKTFFHGWSQRSRSWAGRLTSSDWKHLLTFVRMLDTIRGASLSNICPFLKAEFLLSPWGRKLSRRDFRQEGERGRCYGWRKKLESLLQPRGDSWELWLLSC